MASDGWEKANKQDLSLKPAALLNTQEKRMRATVFFIYNFILEVSEKIVTYAIWKKKLFERAFK